LSKSVEEPKRRVVDGSAAKIRGTDKAGSFFPTLEVEEEDEDEEGEGKEEDEDEEERLELIFVQEREKRFRKTGKRRV